jgi:hypothetical protein
VNALPAIARTLGLALALVLLLAVRALPVWPGPTILGATRLELMTEPAHLIPAFGCPAALLLPVRLTTAGDAAIFVWEDTGEVARVRWPSGWAAWRIGDIAVLIARDGSVVATEGDRITGMGGGYYHDTPGSDEETFHVCVPFG